MSNVYKYYVAQEQKDNTRYIDTNAATEERLKFHAEQEARRRAEAERLSRTLEEDAAEEEEEGEGGEFVAGLTAEEVDPESGEVIGEETIGAEPEEPAEPEIPEDFREMAEQIIGEAEQRAQEILADAGQEAENLKAAANEQGYQEGLAKGRQEAEAELSGRTAELESLKAQLQTEHEEAMKELEPQLLAVILQVFERVFRIQLAGKREILEHLVMNTILNVEDSREFRIRVGAEDASYLTEQLDTLRAQVGGDYSVDIVEDATLSGGQCLIDTDSGVFDCSIDVELENLIRDLKSLAP